MLAEGASRRAGAEGPARHHGARRRRLRGAGRARRSAAPSSLTFPELDRVTDPTDHWPDGYRRQILLRWGDAIFPDSPAFDLATLDGAAAERQFGYNNDFTAFLPLPQGIGRSDHGLLVVNHEYATPFLMFPGVTDEDWRDKLTDAQIARGRRRDRPVGGRGEEGRRRLAGGPRQPAQPPHPPLDADRASPARPPATTG